MLLSFTEQDVFRLAKRLHDLGQGHELTRRPAFSAALQSPAPRPDFTSAVEKAQLTQAAAAMGQQLQAEYANILLEEIENGIEIVEHCLDRVRLLLRKCEAAYDIHEMDEAFTDINVSKNVANFYIRDVLSPETPHFNMKFLRENVAPENAQRLKDLIHRYDDAHIDLEHITNYMAAAEKEGATERSEEEQNTFFAYARPLPESPRQGYAENSFQLAALFAKAAERMGKRMDNLLEQVEHINKAVAPLGMESRDDWELRKILLFTEYGYAQMQYPQWGNLGEGALLQAANHIS